jgi:hypothetical protein
MDRPRQPNQAELIPPDGSGCWAALRSASVALPGGCQRLCQSFRFPLRISVIRGQDVISTNKWMHVGEYIFTRSGAARRGAEVQNVPGTAADGKGFAWGSVGPLGP